MIICVDVLEEQQKRRLQDSSLSTCLQAVGESASKLGNE